MSTRNTHSLAALALAISVTGCATESTDHDREPGSSLAPEATPEATSATPTSADKLAAGATLQALGDIPLEVPRDWLGYELGLRPPMLRPAGRVERFVDVDENQPPDLKPIKVEDVDDRPDVLRATSPDGAIYDVLVSDADFEVLNRELERRGGTGASVEQGATGVASSGGEVIGNGWSNGVDSRVKWPNTSGDWPRDTIGKLSSGCTGTLFEGRLVLTAFHCFFDGFGNWVGNLSFRAGQDGSSKPYGDVGHTWKYWSQNFIDNNCHKWKTHGYTSTCEKYDWAVVVLASTPKTSGGSTPGWMGYHYRSDDDALAGYTQFHRGYPGCSAVNAPADCTASTLWGQSNKCAIGDFFGSVSGLHRNYWHGCDMSGGHSGGPMYSWSPGSHGPYLLGVNIAESCKGTDCVGEATPNVAFRIYKKLAEKMSYYRTIY